MKKFIVLDENNNIENIIVCDSQEIAESITNKVCIFVSDGNDIGIDGWWDGTSVRSFTDRAASSVDQQEDL